MAARIPALLENVKAEARRHEDTDRTVSVVWVVAPVVFMIFFIVLIVLGFILAPVGVSPDILAPLFVGGLAGAVGLLILVAIIFLYLYYILIKRRNQHFARQLRLFESAVTLIREAAKQRDVDVEAKLINIERSLREARDEEGEKGAVLWVVLAFLTFIAALYIYYFLMRDFFKHERRVDHLFEDLNGVLVTLGQADLRRRVETLPERSFAVYLILSIVTLGIFGIYWIYVLIKDPNIHFRQEAQLESELIARLEGLSQ